MSTDQQWQPAKMSLGMDIRFENRTVVVTGAASGIGRVTAEAFAATGAYVFGLDIEGADSSSRKDARMIACDVAMEKSVARAFDIIRQEREHVDILVNNAGIQTYGNVVDTSEALARALGS